ncbi:MAG: hypothetical protein EAZ57_07770 [Cytophagales bacterium]|nr:MAG: hypothetical protein EAZ67_08850 [Cytophagales bacterium]TAF60235.1 MAG: hypothetical protein EAZ57_07770 [Cytophagales bacterium]
MTRKPLLANTKKGYKSGDKDLWNLMDNVPNFIKEILTPEIDPQSDDIHRIISGIPSPWARAMMFAYAIMYNPKSEPGNKTSGLQALYKVLQDEWKGLVALIALDNSPLQVEKIYLTANEPGNPYEMTYGLGQMLFNDKKYWSDPQLLDSEKRPYIQILRYKGTVIGGTYPNALLFTAPNYSSIKPNVEFFKHGRLINPIHYLNEELLQRLYVYVQHIKNNLRPFVSQFGTQAETNLPLSSLTEFLTHWLEEMQQHAQRNNWQLNTEGLISSVQTFLPPFDKVMNAKSVIYGYLGKFYTTAVHESAREVDITELLLPIENCSPVELKFAPDESADRCAVYLLKAKSDVGRYHYFAVPFTQTGIMHFEESLPQVLGYNTKPDFHNTLSAFYDSAKQQLKVTLKLDVDNGKNSVTIEKIYQLPSRPDNVIMGKRIIAFPDFVAKMWNKYYLYSEFPHNSNDPIKAFPLFADENFRLQTIVAHNEHEHVEKAKYRLVQFGDLQNSVKLLVNYNFEKLGQTSLKYEIFQSEQPFRGLELRLLQANAKNEIAGYLLIKDIKFNDPNSFKNMTSQYTTQASLKGVRVGFDFGSNNVCVSFAEQFSAPQLVHFQNRRRFLVGNESPPNQRSSASPHELFFFPNEARKGQVKSMVTIHDERRLKNTTTDIPQAVSGGLPVFESNLAIEEIAQKRFRLKSVGDESVFIYYDMKWSYDQKENHYKEAFLKTLWLQIYAELFEQGFYPQDLAWAYPSAMSDATRISYKSLWNKVALDVNPLEGLMAKVAELSEDVNNPKRALTESEAVCRFALSALGGKAVNKDTLFVGFDVGGSTTDILVVAQNPQTFKNKLIKQSSILVAASAVARASERSERMRKNMIDFNALKGLEIYEIEKRMNASTAPYYLNVIFDKLREQELRSFYAYFYDAGSKEVFAITAYVSGLLLFYAGQVIARTLEHEEYAGISRVQMGFYGKGGRLFDWLNEVMNDVAADFYKRSFLAGLNRPERALTVGVENAFNEHNKSEVSFGLSSLTEIEIDPQERIPEIIGEEGYELNRTPLASTASISTELLRKFNKDFTFPNRFVCLERFANLYMDFCDKYELLNTMPIRRALSNLPHEHFANYLSSHPEFLAAEQNFQKTGKFDFLAPMFVLEGMCLFEKILLPQCKI